MVATSHMQLLSTWNEASKTQDVLLSVKCILDSKDLAQNNKLPYG